MVAPDDLLDGVHEDRARAPRARPSPRRASPGRLTTRQLPTTPARPRESAAVGTPFADAVRPDRLGDAGHLEVEQRPGLLGRAVGRRQAGAAGGEHHAGAARDRRGDGGADRRSPSGTTTGSPTAKPSDRRNVDEQRAGRVVVDAGRRAVGRDDDRRRTCTTSSVTRPSPAQSPDLPPVLVSTRTSVMTAPLSTALTMSMTVSAGDRDRGERLHLDAGAVGGAHGGDDVDGRRRRPPGRR